ncbi:immunity 49 family protein [Grimontia kaedaensis]|uniref:Immunity 49 family protein n=1 Tax=Grimontia kaedaensis TaxID=2872157 RepID=A0ABY4WXN3_9GAMM|nr:Imm49 family immunity protein [Grimontia kaedaensis]USH03733.1 immunity 49 family protein [Grimontia kaedaensis]
MTLSKTPKYDFSVHYFPEKLKANGAYESRPALLIEDLLEAIEWFDCIQSHRYCHILKQKAEDMVGLAAQYNVFNAPPSHIKWLLQQAVNAYRAHFLMQQKPGEEIAFELYGKYYAGVGEKTEKYSNEETWLNALSLAILTGDKQACQDLLKVPTESFEKTGAINSTKTSLVFADLFKAFLGDEPDIDVRTDAFHRCRALAKPGAIEAVDSLFVETYAWFRTIPLFQIVAYGWGAANDDLDTVVKAAMQANYEYFSEIVPRDRAKITGGQPDIGPNSDCLNNDYAMMHINILAFMRVIYQTLGETVSFDSPFLPQWLIKGEGPSLEELKASPPEFDVSIFPPLS